MRPSLGDDFSRSHKLGCAGWPQIGHRMNVNRTARSSINEDEKPL
jgi:hypothetical protein